jgi:hypothetical protein
LSTTQILPPRHFKPAGVVETVQHSQTPPPFIRETKRKGRRGQGIRYEKKGQEHLSELYGDFYVPSPWFYFYELGVNKPRWCQPDGLLFQPYLGRITIVEFKLQHTADAWWQLRWLYLPVVSKAFSGDLWDFSLCEVTKWYDPATLFPEKPRLREEITMTEPGEIGVHIWKPGRLK